LSDPGYLVPEWVGEHLHFEQWKALELEIRTRRVYSVLLTEEMELIHVDGSRTLLLPWKDYRA
jgi:hypothetical protein